MGSRRILDIVVGTTALIFALPIIAVAGLGVKLTSPGPAFYRSNRVGVEGKPFTLLKLRTMHVAREAGSPITAGNDDRVFGFGGWLRKSKIDELPQLWNVVRGDMALVGPRPEDFAIVAQHYDEAERETLAARPGLTSPGTLYYYVCEESMIDARDPVGSYLPVMRRKLAIDAAYARDASVPSDLRVMWTTARLILNRALHRNQARSLAIVSAVAPDPAE